MAEKDRPYVLSVWYLLLCAWIAVCSPNDYGNVTTKTQSMNRSVMLVLASYCIVVLERLVYLLIFHPATVSKVDHTHIEQRFSQRHYDSCNHVNFIQYKIPLLCTLNDLHTSWCNALGLVIPILLAGAESHVHPWHIFVCLLAFLVCPVTTSVQFQVNLSGPVSSSSN